FADELLVVDTGSRDRTPELAAAHGARVVELPWRGFGPTKDAALRLTRGDWILALDADEVVDARLAGAIRSVVEAPRRSGPLPDRPESGCPAHAGPAGYAVCRRGFFLGRWLAHGGWYPDWVLRLVRRGAFTMSHDAVHESLTVDGPVARLEGELLHLTDPDLAGYLRKMITYADLGARMLYDRGVRFRVVQLLVHPSATFLKRYVLKQGWRDGLPGLLLALFSAVHVLVKYARLWELGRAAPRPAMPSPPVETEAAGDAASPAAGDAASPAAGDAGLTAVAEAAPLEPPPVRGAAVPALDAHRILVVRADRLGDVLLALPVLGVLRERLPRAHLTLLTSAPLAPLLAGHPWLDVLHVDDRRGSHAGFAGWRRLVGELRAARHDLALVLRPTLRHASLVRAAGIPVRVGTTYRAYAPLFNRRVGLHRRRSGAHERDLNLRMLAAVIGAVSRRDPWLPVTDASRRAARALLVDAAGRGGAPSGAGDAGALVVVHPGSGGSARDWPLAAWQVLVGDLLGRGFRVAITGMAAEAGRAASIVAAAPAAIDLCGRTELPVLAALLAEASAVIAASTGPLHLATAVGTPVVGLYPPIRDATPLRWGPCGARTAVLQAPAPSCPRCIEERCPYWDCMHAITPDQVRSTLVALLDAHRPRPVTHASPPT
ncbi:MAG: glycosyltransferase family 9 protein, partial [Candidatus Eiseniibacteriota bacterium]